MHRDDRPGATGWRWTLNRLCALTCAALVVAAFVVAPWACDGGQLVYVAAGLLALVALAVLPMLPGFGLGAVATLVRVVAHVVLVVGVWIAGWAIADIRFMCRLF